MSMSTRTYACVSVRWGLLRAGNRKQGYLDPEALLPEITPVGQPAANGQELFQIMANGGGDQYVKFGWKSDSGIRWSNLISRQAVSFDYSSSGSDANGVQIHAASEALTRVAGPNAIDTATSQVNPSSARNALAVDDAESSSSTAVGAVNQVAVNVSAKDAGSDDDVPVREPTKRIR